VVSLADLRDARLTEAVQGAVAWQAFATELRALERRAVEDVIAPLRGSAWEGPASAAAVPHLDGLWEDGSAQLENQAHIVVGQYGRVGLDYGTAPTDLPEAP
jgi:hypothetical protein